MKDNVTKAKILAYFLFSVYNPLCYYKVVGYYQEQFLDSAFALNMILSTKKISYVITYGLTPILQ